MEGEMHKGSFDGYARCLEVRFQKCRMKSVIVSCKVGFWKTMDGSLMPHGKWAWFTTNSHNETKMRTELECYTGDRDSKGRIVVTKVQSKPIEDFYQNEQIKGNPKINLSWTVKL